MEDFKVGDWPPPEFNARIQLLKDMMADAGHPIKSISTKRTAEQQAELFKIGRSTGKSGAIVTQKSGQPGDESKHQLDLAHDFAFVGPNGKATYDGPWDLVGQYAKQLGLEWGGDWKDPYDPGHVQMPSQAKTKPGMQLASGYSTPASITSSASQPMQAGMIPVPSQNQQQSQQQQQSQGGKKLLTKEEFVSRVKSIAKPGEIPEDWNDNRILVEFLKRKPELKTIVENPESGLASAGQAEQKARKKQYEETGMMRGALNALPLGGTIVGGFASGGTPMGMGLGAAGGSALQNFLGQRMGVYPPMDTLEQIKYPFFEGTAAAAAPGLAFHARNLSRVPGEFLRTYIPTLARKFHLEPPFIEEMIRDVETTHPDFPAKRFPYGEPQGPFSPRASGPPVSDPNVIEGEVLGTRTHGPFASPPSPTRGLGLPSASPPEVSDEQMAEIVKRLRQYYMQGK